MGLPDPKAARTAAAVLLAVAALALAADLMVVDHGTRHAKAIPFTVSDGNVTAVGIRITNVDEGDILHAHEMLSSVICGAGNPVILRLVNATDGQEGDRVVLRDVRIEQGGGGPTYRILDGSTNFTGWTVNLHSQRVGYAPIQLHVLESEATEGLLRDEAVPSYLSKDRSGGWGCWDGDGSLVVERKANGAGGAPPGSEGSGPPQQLPMASGIDLVYIVRANATNGTTYALAAEALRQAAEPWFYSTDAAYVEDAGAKDRELFLRTLALVALGGTSVAFMLALRRGPQAPRPAPAGPDAAWGLAAAGEAHLRRLRDTWALFGALLVPLLAAASFLAWSFVTDSPGPDGRWGLSVLVATLLCDLGVLGVWALTLRRVQADLDAWRSAWARMDQTDLDAL